MKRLSSLFCILLTLLFIYNLQFNVFAETEINVNRQCSLNLEYSVDNCAFENVEIKIYKIADYENDGGYNLLSDYTKYPVEVHGITSQTEWKTAAKTLESFIKSDKLEPTAKNVTNKKGIANFGKLSTGLYLVEGVKAENENGVYQFDAFLIFAPFKNDDGGYDYKVTAKPKSVEVSKKYKYSVIKLWKESSSAVSRPESIEIDILKNNEVYKTVTLNSKNDWSYNWESNETDVMWNVVEKNVPKGYIVNVTERDNVFTVVNKSELIEPQDSPQTGDSNIIYLYFVLMFISGISFLLIGIFLKRSKA